MAGLLQFIRYKRVALPTGIEPALFGVTGRRFNRLNYGSMSEDFVEAVPQTALAREDSNLHFTAFYSVASFYIGLLA